MAQKAGIALGVAAPISLGVCAIVWTYCKDFLECTGCMPTIYTGGGNEEEEEEEPDAEEEKRGSVSDEEVVE